MAQPKLKKLLEEYASAVAAVAVENSDGIQSMGSAFHIGEGIFVTARHVVKDMKILSVATKRSTYVPHPETPGARVVTRSHGKGKLIGDPMLHSDENADVALLRVEGIDAPAISLGAHLDEAQRNCSRSSIR
jgi:S1-C subfamily serine protease